MDINVKTKKLPLRSIFYAMEVGDERVYPRFQYSSVRSTASAVKFELGRKYKVSFSEADQMVHVRRVL